MAHQTGKVEDEDRLLVGAGDSIEDLCAGEGFGGFIVVGQVRDDVAFGVAVEQDLVVDADALCSHLQQSRHPSPVDG